MFSGYAPPRLRSSTDLEEPGAVQVELCEPGAESAKEVAVDSLHLLELEHHCENFIGGDEAGGQGEVKMRWSTSRVQDEQPAGQGRLSHDRCAPVRNLR